MTESQKSEFCVFIISLEIHIHLWLWHPKKKFHKVPCLQIYFFSVIKARKCNLFDFEYVPIIHDISWHPNRQILLKVNNRNTRTRCEICSKLTIKTSERRHWRLSGVFIVDFEHISHLVLVFLKLTLSCWMPPAMSQSDSSGFLSTVLESFRYTRTFLTTTNQKASFLNLALNLKIKWFVSSFINLANKRKSDLGLQKPTTTKDKWKDTKKTEYVGKSFLNTSASIICIYYLKSIRPLALHTSQWL